MRRGKKKKATVSFENMAVRGERRVVPSQRRASKAIKIGVAEGREGGRGQLYQLGEKGSGEKKSRNRKHHLP